MTERSDALKKKMQSGLAIIIENIRIGKLLQIEHGIKKTKKIIAENIVER